MLHKVKNIQQNDRGEIVADLVTVEGEIAILLFSRTDNAALKRFYAFESAVGGNLEDAIGRAVWISEDKILSAAEAAIAGEKL